MSRMDFQTQWWLQYTPSGRRTLEKMLPASAIPIATRRKMCAERGHDPLGDGTCRRCGETCVRPSRMVGCRHPRKKGDPQ